MATFKTAMKILKQLSSKLISSDKDIWNDFRVVHNSKVF